MTDQLRQAAQQALEALECMIDDLMCKDHKRVIDISNVAITALKAALEQQQAEPGAWNAGVAPMWPQQKEGETFSVAYIDKPQQQSEPSQWRDMVVVSLVREGINKHKARELADHFATPPQRPWQGLTDEDCKRMSAGDKLVAMWAEAKLKERNT